MSPPHLGWDAVANSIFGYFSWPLRNERQHRETAPMLHSVHWACWHTEGQMLGIPARGGEPRDTHVSVCEKLCATAISAWFLTSFWGFTSRWWSWRSWTKTRVLALERSCAVVIVAWFDLKMCFHAHLWFFFSFLPICALHDLQTKPITHKHMGKIGLSGAWGDECPVPWLQGSTSQNCTSPL